MAASQLTRADRRLRPTPGSKLDTAGDPGQQLTKHRVQWRNESPWIELVRLPDGALPGRGARRCASRTREGTRGHCRLRPGMHCHRRIRSAFRRAPLSESSHRIRLGGNGTAHGLHGAPPGECPVPWHVAHPGSLVASRCPLVALTMISFPSSALAIGDCPHRVTRTAGRGSGDRRRSLSKAPQGNDARWHTDESPGCSAYATLSAQVPTTAVDAVAVSTAPRAAGRVAVGRPLRARAAADARVSAGFGGTLVLGEVGPHEVGRLLEQAAPPVLGGLARLHPRLVVVQVPSRPTHR